MGTSYAGAGVNSRTASGLPAVGAAIRLNSHAVAAIPMQVYTGEVPTKRKAPGSWQHDLLRYGPSSEVSVFDWYSDLEASLEGYGNAYFQKIKRRGKVTELVPLDPNRVQVTRKDGAKRFKVQGEARDLTTSNILHVRGFSYGGGPVGYSPIQIHRQALGAEIAREEFGARFFTNDATPGGAITVPGVITKATAKEMLDYFEEKHGGAGNAHRPAVLFNGASYQQIGVNLADAQFIESMRYGVEKVALIFDIPAQMLGVAMSRTPESVEQETLKWLSFGLNPRLRRIEAAFKADTDLFGPGAGLYPEFDTSSVVRLDAQTRATVYKEFVQSGIWLVDEARAEMGMDPLKDGAGQIPQIVPVGGGPAGVPLPTQGVPDGEG